MSALKDHFNDTMSSGYSVSFFMDWKNKNINQVWVKSVIDSGPEPDLEIYGAKKVVDIDLHPIMGLPIDDVTVQRGVPGPWCDKLPYYKIDVGIETGMPGMGIELQVIPLSLNFVTFFSQNILSRSSILMKPSWLLKPSKNNSPLIFISPRFERLMPMIYG
uniref:Uncharacterized protein n=1 Tax=Acrobeloides nanus TaxID=290746 RepID=A0A914D335_9BILA